VNNDDVMAHDEARELLPWLVNDSLAAGERERVREHASSCVICRRELDDLRQVQSSIRHEADAVGIPEPDMRHINARIDALMERERWGTRLLTTLRESLGSPQRIAFAAQSALVVVLLAIILRPEPEPAQFTTLTTPETLPAGEYIRVVFDPALPAVDIDQLLEPMDLELVSGPSERGVATLRIAPGSSNPERATLINRLLDDPRVLFAQQIAERE